MSGSLGHLIIIVRLSISTTAGPSLEEGQWGVGQVMALVTWLPTVMDFILVYIEVM